MIRLATAAYAHHNDVNAYRFTSITTSRITRLAAPKITISLIFEKNSAPQVATIYSTATTVLFVAWFIYTMLFSFTEICTGYAIKAHKIYNVNPVPKARNGSILLRS